MCDKVVCDKVLCDKVVCDKVVCDKVVCDKVVCDKVYVRRRRRGGGGGGGGPRGGCRSKNKNPTQFLWGTRTPHMFLEQEPHNFVGKNIPCIKNLEPRSTA